MILMRMPIGMSPISLSFGVLWSVFNWNVALKLNLIPPLFTVFIRCGTHLTRGLFNAVRI